MTDGTPVEAHAALGRLVAHGIDEIVRAEEGWADIVEEAAYSVDVETRDRGTWTISVARKVDAPPPATGEELDRELAREAHAARASFIADWTGPVVSFDVGPTFYLASCDACGWVGSSERCGTDVGLDDSSVYCPRCMSAGADCGQVAAAVATRGEPPLAMILDAHLPSMTGRFRLPPGLRLASGVFALTRLRSPTDADKALWSHLPEPPRDAPEVAEDAAELVRAHAARLGMDSMAAGILVRAIMKLGEDPK